MGLRHNFHKVLFLNNCLHSTFVQFLTHLFISKCVHTFVYGMQLKLNWFIKHRSGSTEKSPEATSLSCFSYHFWKRLTFFSNMCSGCNSKNDFNEDLLSAEKGSVEIIRHSTLQYLWTPLAQKADLNNCSNERKDCLRTAIKNCII